jgi:hypothetical protein
MNGEVASMHAEAMSKGDSEEANHRISNDLTVGRSNTFFN